MINDRTLGAVCAFELEGKSDYLNPISKKIKAYSLTQGVMIRPLGNTCMSLLRIRLAKVHLIRFLKL